MSEDKKVNGPDLRQGVRTDGIVEGGMLAGHVDNQAVLIARVNDKLYAIDSKCTHYQGPLAEGLVVDHTVRCPLHHACFDLRTGNAIAAPAIDPVTCWVVEEQGGLVFVKARKQDAASPRRSEKVSRRVIIIGGGAAGFAAAEMLRREGFGGDLTLLSADSDAPYDRPNCSKDYLSGGAPKEWMPLRDGAFYKDNKIDLHVNAVVASFDPKRRTVSIKNGNVLPYDVLILATGAEPQRPPIPGLDRANVFTLRTLKDADSIIAAAEKAKHAAVIGASFIGLEVAAALRQRGLDVHVIAPETIPLEKIMGHDIGSWIKGVHERKGVIFHLGREVLGYADGKVTMDHGDPIAADLVVVGTGVKPRVDLAEAAGLKVDDGVIVDNHLKTSADDVYAAGDIARYPDPVSGHLIRVEHWVHAERQGQYLARQILGEDKPFDDPPFFWSSHYDKTVNYSGHAITFDRPQLQGSLIKEDVIVRFYEEPRLLAVATVGRDLANLEAERAFAAKK
jgi:NADPH-dependent 2,4-dienoyl-CoA reductase/sulfur reductase-like enzyme/nitrite reductase/ring-hydroxylating ferredoxin subunit